MFFEIYVLKWFELSYKIKNFKATLIANNSQLQKNKLHF